jgi:RNA 2',3'-cyclic 3'-phosphodiesterase
MRLFVAINFPASLREDIWTASASLRDAGLPVRWVEQAALHLTLKFLGSVGSERTPDIVSGLEAATRQTRPFALPLGGFGAFPSLERPRVIWVGCDGVPQLELLQHAVEVEMDRLGFEVEGRPFHPHLTLGRVERDARPQRLGSLDALLEGLEFQGETAVASVELMESTTGPQGSHYRAVHSAGLGNQS